MELERESKVARLDGRPVELSAREWAANVKVPCHGRMTSGPYQLATFLAASPISGDSRTQLP